MGHVIDQVMKIPQKSKEDKTEQKVDMLWYKQHRPRLNCDATRSVQLFYVWPS